MKPRGVDASRRSRAPAALWLILVLGLAVRLPGLGRDLVCDEALSLFAARGTDAAARIVPNGPAFTSSEFARDGGWGESLLAIGHTERTPPLYYLLLRVWIKLWGDSNHSVRLLSVSFGVATIPALYWLGRRAVDRRTGLAAAGVLALLPLHVQYSQEVRAYALAVLFLTLASWAYWEASQATDRRAELRYWLLYAGLAAASLYTHYFAAGVLAAHVAFACMRRDDGRSRLLWRLALVSVTLILLLSPWILGPYFRNQRELHALYESRPTLSLLENPTRLGVSLSISNLYLSAGGVPEFRLKSLPGVGTLFLFIFCGFVLLSAAVKGRHRNELQFFALLYVMPVVFMILMSNLLGYSPDANAAPRFAVFAAIGLSLLFGLAVACTRWRPVSCAIVLLLLAMLLNFQLHFGQVYHSLSLPPFGQWHLGHVGPVVNEVDNLVRPGDLVLFDDEYVLCVWNAYQSSDVEQLYMSRIAWDLNQPMDLEARWDEVERSYSSIYLVRRAAAAPSDAMQLLEARYLRESQQRIERLEVRHYRR